MKPLYNNSNFYDCFNQTDLWLPAQMLECILYKHKPLLHYDLAFCYELQLFRGRIVCQMKFSSLCDVQIIHPNNHISPFSSQKKDTVSFLTIYVFAVLSIK